MTKPLRSTGTATVGSEVLKREKKSIDCARGHPRSNLGRVFAPIWLFGVIIAVICGFVAFELMRCAIGQAPKRLYISSILSAVAIAIFGGLDLRMAAIILLFLFFVLSCEMMACFSTPRKISMEMVAISMLAGGVLPMMLSTLLRIAQFETTISIPELLNGNSTLVRITHDGIVGRVRAFLPFVVAFGSDAGAYFCGRAFGKKQLAPAISPHKTVAGGIGGAVCGAAMALLYGVIVRACGLSANLVSLAAFGLVGSVVAQLGDLTFSACQAPVRYQGLRQYPPRSRRHARPVDSMYYLAPLTELWMLLLPAISA